MVTKSVKIIDCMGRGAKTVNRVFSYLEANPIIEIQKTSATLEITFNTVSAAINRLVDADILVQTNNASRNRTFSYGKYLDILRGGTE